MCQAMRGAIWGDMKPREIDITFTSFQFTAHSSLQKSSIDIRFLDIGIKAKNVKKTVSRLNPFNTKSSHSFLRSQVGKVGIDVS